MNKTAVRAFNWRLIRWCGLTLIVALFGCMLALLYSKSDSVRDVGEVPGGHDGLRRLACSPTGEILVTGSTSGEVRVWSVTSKALIYRDLPAAGWIEDVSFSPNGRLFAVCGASGVIGIYASGKWERIRTLQEKSSVLSIAFIPGQETIVVGLFTGEVLLKDACEGKTLTAIEGKWDFPEVIRMSPKGDRLAVGGSNGILSIAELRTAKVTVEFQATHERIVSLAFSPDASTLATGDSSGNVGLWDTRTGRKKACWTAHNASVQSLAYLRESVIMSAGSCSRLRFWDTEDGGLLAEFSERAIGPLECAAYCPRNRCVAIAFYHGAIRFVDVGEVLRMREPKH